MRVYKCIATTALLAAILISAPYALAESKRVIANSTSQTTIAPIGGISEVNVIVTIPQTQTTTPPIKGEDKTPDYVSDAIAITAQAESHMSNTLTLLGYFIAVVAIVVGIIIARGFFSIKAMNDIYKLRDELESLVTDSKEHASRIEALHNKLSEDVNPLLSKIMAFSSDSNKKVLTDDERATLDKAASSLEMLELLGQKLTPEDYFSLAYDYALKGNHQKAIEFYEKVPKDEIFYIGALINKANILSELREFPRAIKEYDKGIKLDINNRFPEAYSGKGLVLSRQDKHKEACLQYKKALEINPDDPLTRSNMGASLIELNELDEAMIELNSSIKIDINHANAYINRAYVYVLINKKSEALKDLSRAIDLDGEFREEARSNKDFASLHDDPEFRKLVGMDDEGGTPES